MHVPSLLRLSCVLVLGLCLAVETGAASFLERLGVKRGAQAVSLAELTEEQAVSGLREALARGAQHAVTHLGRPDGFLKDALVRIPVPERLQTVERGLRLAGTRSHGGRISDDDESCRGTSCS
ncbi:MAG: DUF4197 domain-containing protein [Verrucomicrobia bacterium]|nr:DUF4197 domain-containing protein [Verrucomicrobiota bacterium]